VDAVSPPWGRSGAFRPGVRRRLARPGGPGDPVVVRRRLTGRPGVGPVGPAGRRCPVRRPRAARLARRGPGRRPRRWPAIAPCRAPCADRHRPGRARLPPAAGPPWGGRPRPFRAAAPWQPYGMSRLWYSS